MEFVNSNPLDKPKVSRVIIDRHLRLNPSLCPLKTNLLQSYQGRTVPMALGQCPEAHPFRRPVLTIQARLKRAQITAKIALAQGPERVSVHPRVLLMFNQMRYPQNRLLCHTNIYNVSSGNIYRKIYNIILYK